jgi:hypothetical protein
VVRRAGRDEARDAMTNASISNPPVRPTLQTTLGRLRRANAGLDVLHLIQGIAILVLASAFSLPLAVCTLRGRKPLRGPLS